MALSDEQKSKMLARLKEGRERVKKMREEAKAAGKPDPKPRKPRAKKDKNKDGALDNPAAAPAANETIPPIDGAPRNAENVVAAKPLDPTATKSKPIDVPNLPGDKVSKVVPVVDPLADAPARKGIAPSGVPEKYISNEVVMNEETGMQVISAQFPGQKESIKKALEENKKENKPLAPSAVPDPPNKTVKKVKMHVPDVKAVEGRAPFSMSSLRKMLYQ